MKTFAIQPAREGVTKYIATMEAFENSNEDNQDDAFEFETLDEAIKEAAHIARNRKDNVLIIERRNFTNGWCHGIGWVKPNGGYYERD